MINQGWVMAIYRYEHNLNNVHIVDTHQFNLQSITSVFCYYDGEQALLFDTGTSDNVERILSSLANAGIPVEKLAGVVPSHYHFDHGGGCSAFWHRMQKINPDFRIYTGELTKLKLQAPGYHIKGASTTFGSFTGTMEMIPDEAFIVIPYNSYLPMRFNNGARVLLLHTPGHTHDHCSPSVMIDGRCVFCFSGETCGTSYTDDAILTTPTSMPPNFSYKHYMHSMKKVRSLNPEMIGFCHFGIISGKEHVDELFADHEKLMIDFIAAITEAFNENPSTSHVLQRTEYLWKGRISPSFKHVKGSEHFFQNLQLAITYGAMIDLGFRESKYETRTDY